MRAHPTRRQAIVGAVGVGAQCRSPWRTQGGRSTKTCRDKRGRKGDWDVPFRILSVTTHFYPAIVLDGQAVVYGVTDVKTALHRYRPWQEAAGL